MRYIRKIWIIIGTIFLATVTNPSDANAQLLLGFNETFDSSVMPGWEFRWAKVDEGILQIKPDGFAQRDGLLHDFALSVVAKYDQDGVARIVYHKGESESYLLQFAKRWISLSRLERELGRAEHEIGPGEWAQIEIRTVGGEQTILLNNQPVISLHDPTPLAYTGIQLSATGSKVEFDNLIMTNMDPALSITPILIPLSTPKPAPHVASPTSSSAIPRLVSTKNLVVYIFVFLLLVTTLILFIWRWR
jgi:hypothetical protein